MKRIIILCALIFAGCSSEWDSGGEAASSYQQQREQEQTSAVREQFPDTKAGTEQAQPQ